MVRGGKARSRAVRTGAARVEPGSGQRRVLAPATVLIADDDDDTRSALKRVFAREGYEVIEAADGAQTLELLASAADGRAPLPDVVLLDFVMPGFSGLGILGVMRRFPKMPPTILMTGFPNPSVELFAMRLGAIRVLRKPLDEERMSALVLEAAMLGSRARAPAPHE